MAGRGRGYLSSDDGVVKATRSKVKLRTMDGIEVDETKCR